MSSSLWGDEFVVTPSEKTAKKIINKINNPSKPKSVVRESTSHKKNISDKDRVEMITSRVKSILGVYIDRTQVIRTREDLHTYLEQACINGYIAIDTETNNTLSPVGCKLMGVCIYTPGMSSAYIPINHVNIDTRELLSDQLNETDIYDEFSILKNKGVKVIVHNGKFDYQVLKYTTGWQMPMYWDTIIAARILDENEPASLKAQYIKYIDPEIEKYSIESLFEDISYEIVDPVIFSLYAATDAYMTYQLYLYQYKEFMRPENKRIFDLFMNIEMPDVEVFAEMEFAGVELCIPYAERLQLKYGNMLQEIQNKIDTELSKYASVINEWRKSPEANYHRPKDGQTDKYEKSLNEILHDPINLASPKQLAILLYDILKVPVVDKKYPRSTKEEILMQIDLPLCKLILEYRGLAKLISTYIVALPKAVSEVDGRVHTQYNQIGAGTGRVSSDSPNLQNIPSENRELRMLFKASDIYNFVPSRDNSYYDVSIISDVKLDDGSWVSVDIVKVGDILECEEDSYVIVDNIERKGDVIRLFVRETFEERMCMNEKEC